MAESGEFLKSTRSYGLAAGTTLHIKADQLFLLLNYPLKFVALHHSWQPLLQALDDHPIVALEQMAAVMPDISPEKTAAFLDQLVYKGFLTRIGSEGLAEAPLVSVIIPVRNRPLEIGMCLTAIGRLDYPADKIEIIVVDDASTDTTADEAAKSPVKLIRLKHHRQASFCRNAGARLARGDILAFIDSDCLAHPRWLLELVPAFADTTLAAVGGRIDAYQPQKKLDLYEKAKSSLMVSTYARQSQKEDPFFYVPACNFLIRRRTFLDLKGFDEGLNVGEDVDLCWRLQDHPYRIAFRPAGIVFHQHRNRLPAFCKRRYQYGTSEPLLQNLHPGRRKKFLAPPAALTAWAGLILWALTGFWLYLGLAGLTMIGGALLKKRRFRQIPIGLGSILTAELRACGAFGYHLCAFVSRYYLFLGLICLPLLPPAAGVIAAMHLINGAVEFRLKKPSLNFAWFMGYFTLEQLAYQAGVWRACIRHGTLKPVFPKIITRSDNP